MIKYILLPLMLTGCTPKLAPPVPLEYQCPIITLPQEPVWQTRTLGDTSSHTRVIQTLVADNKSCHAYIKASKQMVHDDDIAEGNT